MSTNPTKYVDAYRQAAVEVLNISAAEAAVYIKSPVDDRGEWAPDALVIIYTEADCRTPEDTGTLPELLGYYYEGPEDYTGKVNARAAELLGGGARPFIEPINAAVCAVWE